MHLEHSGASKTPNLSKVRGEGLRFGHNDAKWVLPRPPLAPTIKLVKNTRGEPGSAHVAPLTTTFNQDRSERSTLTIAAMVFQLRVVTETP